MALICTTPVLGFTPETFEAGAAIPYWTGMDGAVTPQIGAIVDVLDDETGASARYEMTETGWVEVEEEGGGGG